MERDTQNGTSREPVPPGVAEYGVQALWNKRLIENPNAEDALVIARTLRIEGNREARKLAEAIEQAFRAAV